MLYNCYDKRKIVGQGIQYFQINYGCFIQMNSGSLNRQQSN